MDIYFIKAVISEHTNAQLPVVVTMVNKKLAFLGEQSVPGECDAHAPINRTLQRFHPQSFIQSDEGVVNLLLYRSCWKESEITGRSHSLVAILDIQLLVNPMCILLHRARRQH